MSDEARGPSPELGGKDEGPLVERASATPIRPLCPAHDHGARGIEHRTATSAPTATGPIVGAVVGPLPGLLAWFTNVLTHPESAARGIEASQAEMRALGADSLEALVTRGPRLSAVERIGIYQYAYHTRLVECLADDYPGVKHALGEARFEVLARRYIEAHPSRAPSLNGYGRQFAEFASRASDDFPEAAFLADLARLEWAMVEVLHARPTPALSMAALQDLPPEAWPGIRLVPAPTLRFLEFDYPVNRHLQAVRRGESPVLPERAWSGTAVYRRGFVIWRMDFTPPMAGVLRALIDGRPLGEALETLAEHEDERLVQDVMVWFQEWVAGAFFERIERPTQPE